MWSGWYAPVGDAEFGETASAGYRTRRITSVRVSEGEAKWGFVDGDTAYERVMI